MQLTAEQLNRATLARQSLLARSDGGVVEVVRRAVALQGQEPAAPYVALFNRIEDFDPVALDEVLADQRLVKATLMRVTLHVVAAADHRWMRAAMLPRIRASRVNDRRFILDGHAAEDADELVADLLAVTADGATPSEILDSLAERRGEPVAERLWWALRTYAPLVRHPTGDPWSFGTTTVFRPAPVGDDDLPPRDDAVAWLVRRYLDGFGPATIADVAQFTLLTRTTIRAAVARLRDELVEHDGPDGTPVLDVHDGEVPPIGTAAPPRLLGMWDSILLAHHDRSRVVSDEHRPTVIRRNGDTLPTVIVDGRVAGVWRVVDDRVEVTPFAPLGDDVLGELAEEAASLLAMLDGRGAPFTRYHRWWTSLPTTDRVVLPAPA